MKSANREEKDLLRTTFDLVDSLVELYLKSAVAPFLKLHEKFYTGLNKVLRQVLDSNEIPTWFTANFITYGRTLLVFPTILLLASEYQILPALLAIFVDFGDFLDGVVARYWVDQDNKKVARESRSASPTSDKDSFEVVNTGSPQKILSWVCTQRNRNYGGFVDAVMDKCYVIPCWISLLRFVPGSRYLQWFQYLTLCGLIMAEAASGGIRFRAYYTSSGAPAPPVVGFDFSTSAVKADHVGKAKQTFEMLGTALFIVGITRYIGLLLLSLALPLAYESVRRKVVTRVIYVSVDSTAKFDHKLIKFWMQVSALGSKLVVGVVGNNNNSDMVLNACAISCVENVIAEAPTKADLMFLEKNRIDFVVMAPGQSKFVTDEVVNANRVLAIGEDGVAHPVTPKLEGKAE